MIPLCVQSTMQVLGWGQAWIDLIDIKGPLFPGVREV